MTPPRARRPRSRRRTRRRGRSARHRPERPTARSRPASCPSGASRAARVASTGRSVSGASRIITLPTQATTSYVVGMAGRGERLGRQLVEPRRRRAGRSGKVRRDCSRISGSKSTPTTRCPRATSAAPTRPIPDPASRTQAPRGASTSASRASPSMSTPSSISRAKCAPYPPSSRRSLLGPRLLPPGLRHVGHPRTAPRSVPSSEAPVSPDAASPHRVAGPAALGTAAGRCEQRVHQDPAHVGRLLDGEVGAEAAHRGEVADEHPRAPRRSTSIAARRVGRLRVGRRPRG